MSLTSQLITDVFPDLEKVRKLNIEAFPEEERVPLDEFLLYQDRDDAHFFAFYNEEEFVGFAFAISNQKAFYISFFAIMPHLRSHGYGKEIIEKLIDFLNETIENFTVKQLLSPEEFEDPISKGFWLKIIEENTKLQSKTIE